MKFPLRAFLATLLCQGMLFAQTDNEDLEAKLRESVPDKTDAASKKIISTHLQALGGTGRIKLIANTIFKGTLKEAKQDYTVKYYRAAPDKLRVETSRTVLGTEEKAIQGTNGEICWTFSPNTKNAIPREVGGKEAEEFKIEADFYGPLVDWQEKGYVFRYEGEVKSRGRKHYLVKMFFPSGHSLYFYFDAKTMMVTRMGREKIVSGSIVDTDTFFTKYERIEGVWMPSKMEFAIENQVFGSLEFESMVANQPMDSELFNLPKVKEVWLRKK